MPLNPPPKTTRFTVQKFGSVPQTAIISSGGTFRTTLGSNEQVPSDFEIFDFCAWPAAPTQNGQSRDFAILEVLFLPFVHLRNAKISKRFNLEPMRRGVTKNRKFQNLSELA